MRDSPELLAPAGNWDCARAAAANGADAIYFGLPRFNARLRADNFTAEELPRVVEFCHARGMKAFVTFNTLVFTDELEDAAACLRLLNSANVDALIVQDIGLARLARELTPELPLHASTQMTITSPEGVRFAENLGIRRAVLARELSLRELEKFCVESRTPNVESGNAAQPSTFDVRPSTLPLEVFVHGALCVAYSGQCLTSESLGQRSANRGECAQACRMPYELIVDGALRDLGERRYLLSPQDLAAVNEIPALIALGIASFKIEGRLKSPEYVAAVTQVYRKAIDAALASPAPPAQNTGADIAAEDRYALEMTFSRGLSTGWMHGVNHQQLVPARFGKKRGPLAGRIARVGRDFVELDKCEAGLKPGDGVVFDTGGDTDREQGGRIFSVKNARLFFQRGHIDFARLRAGDRVWKTDDPELNSRLRKSFAGHIAPRRREKVALKISGRAGELLVIEGRSGEKTARVFSAMPLQAARTAPLTDEKLREHLGRFGDTVFVLDEMENALEGAVILPISELNRMRRGLASQLDSQPARTERKTSVREILARLTAGANGTTAGKQIEDGGLKIAARDSRHLPSSILHPRRLSPTAVNHSHAAPPQLAVLCRTSGQVEAALACGVSRIYADFEDIRRGRDAVALVRAAGGQPDAKIFLATPRIQKAGESGFFKVIENAAPDGVLIRNLGAIEHFAKSPLQTIGDFSLNVANPLAAAHFKNLGLALLTVSYDLNIAQTLALLAAAPPAWFDLTLHQHMPMFHMEHCVFAAFMSKGASFLDCGRPCEKHRVALRDRVGIEHPLRADVGCRNTLFNAVPQTGARFFPELLAAGLRSFRIELLEENAADAQKTIRAYQSLLRGERDGETLWRELRAQSQLGVTRGTL